jgi:leader peptidase (prepilin peptidase)/N-methyltransferase
VWQQRAYLSIDDAWLFSPTVFAAMLGILLGADLADLLTSRNGTRMLARLGSWNWHRIAIYSFVFAFLIYMVIVPAAISIYESMQPAKTAEVLQDKMTLSEKIRLRTVEAMTGLVFFALGATIGSFLNVVVFRMPRGESVVFRPSRCPSCETPIKGRDNVPILGWLMLNGQCRSCQIPISPRYPIVEMICASIFLLLYFVELISGGANLPVRKPNFYRGVVLFSLLLA